MAESFLPPVVAEFGANVAPFLEALSSAVAGLREFAAAADETVAQVSGALARLNESVGSAAGSVASMAAAVPEEFAAVSAAAEGMATSTGEAFKTLDVESRAAAASVKATAAETDAAAVSGVAAAAKSESAFARMASSTGAGLSSVVSGLKTYAAGLGLVGGGVIFEAVKGASNLEAEITRLNTQAGVSKSQLGILRDGVLQLAADTGQNPNSLAEALFHVESNFESLGITAPKALELTRIAAEGAKLGGANLVDVTNALTAAVASGIPGVENMSQAMGSLNAIVGSGDMKMQDLASAFGSGMVATVKGFGLSLNDVGAALAVFGDNNIRGSLAGTQLRMSVMALANPIKTSAAALHTLGLEQDTLAKDMQKGGLKLALEDLQDRMRKAGISADQQGQIITEAFGRKAGAGLNVLMDQMDRFESKYPAIQEGAGKFAGAWDTASQTMSVRFDQLKGAIEGLAIRVGTMLLPAAEKLVAWLRDGIGWLTRHKGVVEALAGAIGGLLVGAIVLLGSTLTTALLSPAGLVITAIAGLGAAVVYAYNHSAEFRRIVNEIGNFLAGAFKAAWDTAGQVIHWFATTVMPMVKTAIHDTIQWFQAHKEDFHRAWDQVLKAVHVVVKWFDDNVLKWVRERIAELVKWWDKNSQSIHQVWTIVWKLVESTVKAFWDGFMKPTLVVIEAVWSATWAVLKDTLKLAWDIIKDIVTASIHWVENILSLVLDVITGKWGRVWGDLKKILGDAWHDMTRFLGDAVSGFGDLLYDAGKNLIKGLISGIKSMVSAVKGTVGDLASGIKGFFNNSPAKEGPLAGTGGPEYMGAAFVRMYAGGMDSSNHLLTAASGRLAGATSLAGRGVAAVGGALPGLAVAEAGGGTTVVNNYITVQGSVLAEHDLRDVVQQQMLRLGMSNSQTWTPYGRR